MENILHLHKEHVETSAAHRRYFFQVVLASSPLIAGYFYFFFLDFFTVASQGPVKFWVTVFMGVFMCLVCGALMAGDIGTAIRAKRDSERAYLDALRAEMVHYGIDPDTVVNHTTPDQNEYKFSALLKGREYEFCVTRSGDSIVFMRGGFPMTYSS